jgi:MerR family transcriptional regulator, redox-sensitive transcriptional activator SoxR
MVTVRVAVKVSLMSNPEHALTIGAVAALAGRRPSSIRYYEQIGLLPAAARVAGRRVYGPDTVRTLAVIETGQRAGLTLDEIRALLSASPDDQVAIERLREVAARKLPEITALIERSQVVRGWLESAARCECPSLGQCALFDDPALLPSRDRDLVAAPRSKSGGTAARHAGKAIGGART